MNNKPKKLTEKKLEKDSFLLTSLQNKLKKSPREVLKDDIIFQKIFETLPAGIELYDEKGLLIKANPYDLALMGSTQDSIFQVNIFDDPNFPPDFFEKIKAGEDTDFEIDYNFEAVKNKSYFRTSHRNETIRLSGRCIPFKDDAGKITGYVFLVHHDKDYYKKKELLQSSLTKLKMAVDTGKSFIWEYNIKTNKATIDYNLLDYEEGVPAYTHEELNQTGMEEHLKQVHPEDMDRILAQAKSLMDGEIDSFTESYRQTLNGETHWYTTYFKAYKYGKDNKPEVAICLTTDITLQRENELELIQAREKDKIKTAFIKNISHELRTPLNAIVGFSNILVENNNTEENRYFIDIIEKNNTILLRLIDSMLNFTKIETNTIEYEIEEVDLKSACQEAFNFNFPNKSPHIHFAFDESLPSIPVKIDKLRTVQVLYHLLDNAFKYTEEGSISLSYHLCDKKKVRLEVRDTGIGLSQEEIKNIFQHFYKVDEFNVGLGLGLCIAKKIVEDLGGDIGIDSTKGKGSTFWFTLPLANA